MLSAGRRYEGGQWFLCDQRLRIVQSVQSWFAQFWIRHVIGLQPFTRELPNGIIVDLLLVNLEVYFIGPVWTAVIVVWLVWFIIRGIRLIVRLDQADDLADALDSLILSTSSA